MTAEALAKIGLSGEDVRKSLKEKGLLATMQDLIKLTDGNVDSLGRIFPNVEGLVNVLGTAKLQGDEYAKALRNMGDSTDIVNEGFEKVSQTAGFKLKVAMETLRNLAIDLGSTLIPVIADVLGPLNQMLQLFGHLPGPVKSLAVGFGGLLIALGPMMAVWGNMKVAFGVIAGQLKSLVVGVNAAAASFMALSVAQKATIIGLAVAAIMVWTATIKNLNDETRKLTVEQRTLNDVNQKASQTIAAEKVEAERLVGVLKNENATRDEKARALGRLKEINGQYFGQLDVEKSKVEDVSAAMVKYIAAIEQRARLTAANEKLIDVEKRLLDVQTRVGDAKPDWMQTIGNALVTGGQGAAFYVEQSKTLVANFSAENDALEKQKKTLLDFIGTSEIASTSTVKLTKTTASHSVGIGEATDKTKAYFAALKEISDIQKTQNALGEIDFGKQMDAVKGGIGKLIEAGFSVDSAEVKNLQSQLAAIFSLDQGVPMMPSLAVPEGVVSQNDAAAASIDRIAASLLNLKPAVEGASLSFSEQWTAAMEEVSLSGNTVEQAAMAMGQSMMNSAAQGETSLASMANAALGAAAKVIRAYIMEATAATVAKSLATVPFPFNLAVAAAAGGAVGVLFNGLMGKIGIPALAEGGLAFGPTLAMVGDNPGAGANPEVIAPLDKLQAMMQSGGGQHVTVTGVMRGRDMFLTNERAGREMGRVRGF
jgi:hypothetical protein